MAPIKPSSIFPERKDFNISLVIGGFLALICMVTPWYRDVAGTDFDYNGFDMADINFFAYFIAIIGLLAIVIGLVESHIKLNNDLMQTAYFVGGLLVLIGTLVPLADEGISDIFLGWIFGILAGIFIILNYKINAAILERPPKEKKEKKKEKKKEE
ncbi:MAG: hypothetical protein ACFE68_08690 [Candidatus Hodarchaeota archaeon]